MFQTCALFDFKININTITLIYDETLSTVFQRLVPNDVGYHSGTRGETSCQNAHLAPRPPSQV